MEARCDILGAGNVEQHDALQLSHVREQRGVKRAALGLQVHCWRVRADEQADAVGIAEERKGLPRFYLGSAVLPGCQ
eukprot:3608795-Prymnesium_polylepis.1